MIGNLAKEALLGEQPETGSVQDAERHRGLVMIDKPHLDEEALAELRDVMEDEFDVLIHTYISDSADRITTLRQALEEADDQTFTKSAHSFKGSSVNIGAPLLGALCLQAETAGRNGKLSEAAETLDVIEQEFQTVRGLFEKLLTS